MLEADVAVSEVSEPEKKPENIIKKIITTRARISSISIGVDLSF